jgi:hypothetical protein
VTFFLSQGSRTVCEDIILSLSTTFRAVTTALKDFTEENFQKYFQRWQDSLQWYVAFEGNHFEGDHVGM